MQGRSRIGEHPASSPTQHCHAYNFIYLHLFQSSMLHQARGFLQKRRRRGTGAQLAHSFSNSNLTKSVECVSLPLRSRSLMNLHSCTA